MKKSIGLWGLVGFALTSLMGTVLHFLYDWTGESLLVAPFSGVNESTWEHMKLLFWPMFIFLVIQSFYFRGRDDFFCIKLRGVLLGLFLIPIIFYTYNGVIGKSPDWVNITIFLISAAAVYIYETRQFKKKPAPCPNQYVALAILVFIAILFTTFTFKTPTLGIFKDPVSGTFGIQKSL